MAVAARPAPRQISAPTPRVALLIATAIVIGVVLYMARGALAPFVVGALLIYLLDPAVSWIARIRIGRRKVPRGLAVLIVYVLTVILLYYGLRLLLGPLVSQLLEYVADLPALIASFQELAAELGEMYRGLDLPEPVREFFDDALAGIGQGAGGVDFGALVPLAGTILGTAAGFFAFLIIPVWAFYLLRDRVRLQQQLFTSLPPAWRDEVWSVLTIIERVFGRWIRGQILLGLIVGAATFGGLVVLGLFVDESFIRFAVLLAVIAGVLELLPIIGPIIAMIPTLLIALITRDPVLSVIAVLVLYIAVQQLENAVLVPKIQGDAVDLHASVVIFALIVGGAIAGLLGAILAIPITAAARDVYRYLFRRLSPDYHPPPSGTGDEPGGLTDTAESVQALPVGSPPPSPAPRRRRPPATDGAHS